MKDETLCRHCGARYGAHSAGFYGRVYCPDNEVQIFEPELSPASWPKWSSEHLRALARAEDGVILTVGEPMTEQFYDKKGVPICKGDLLRTPHFIGVRRKQHYLYHTIVEKDGRLFGIPTGHLEPTNALGGGEFPLWACYKDSWKSEIIHGHGPGGVLSYEDRPKRLAKQPTP